MRDEIDARIWADHHEVFAEGIDRALLGLRSAAARFAAWDGSSHQLIALLLAFAITGLTFNNTAA
ncbi:hypothetical protein [Sphingosinicella sp. CPCC 101087]|uniref:hypothetical protein n=1 Tax=Sphingosinicella sp. CPCC 101087 TaxID=2497754 RepID=UPI00101B795C|nr:hypothetical protein [Sphingosinicella sp. CPCC 101087]